MNLLASSGQLRASFARWALVFVPALVLLGFLSGKMAQSGPDNPWFAALVKPEVYPPPAAFGIVWTILYVLMGLALAMVAAARGARGRGIAVLVFAVQFALNLAWSPVFFGAHQITGGLIVIAVLDVLVLLTAVLFYRVRPIAAALLVPYLAWILFATYLNYAFLEANPKLDGVDVVPAVERFEI
ncbi:MULTISPECIES: TspO/MBR family protein [Novosphingobium]|uniref:TspO and MBR related proteins n=1 Tax=Novosphingobium mathurense TaxID=428990 RepID=A0A1U6GU29_9SPHN|nr:MULTISPECIES: TspO/MBR family protein [Novosphingobium]CDO35364.1 TspO and MBR like protein [Novosphingobium sp. KN65.2]SLJ87039.1 TspO and MBR related proteins [Novosphingobium mathurense]